MAFCMIELPFFGIYRLVSGAALVAVYTRSRWMDMQHTDEVVMDPDPNDPVFVELKIKEFKTKKANAWRWNHEQLVQRWEWCRATGSELGGSSDNSWVINLGLVYL